MRGYDAWKTSPPEHDGPEECPKCGAGGVNYDRADRSAWCDECGWADGFDWEAAAERQAEMRSDGW